MRRFSLIAGKAISPRHSAGPARHNADARNIIFTLPTRRICRQLLSAAFDAINGGSADMMPGFPGKLRRILYIT